MDVSNLPPKVGGGYPAGTDFSLLAQTQWRGPPHPDTLALPSRHAAAPSVGPCHDDEAEQAAAAAVGGKGAADEPLLLLPPPESEAESDEGGETRSGSPTATSSATRSTDDAPAEPQPMAGRGSSGDSSRGSAGGLLLGDTPPASPADDSAAARARAARAIAASGLDRGSSPASSGGGSGGISGGGSGCESTAGATSAAVTIATREKRAGTEDEEDVGVRNALIDEDLAEPVSWRGSNGGGKAANGDCFGAYITHDTAAARVSSSGSGVATERRTGSPEDKDGKHHKRVAAGAAALFVVGTLTAGVAVAAVAVGGGVAGYYHRRREKEREAQRTLADSGSSGGNGGAGAAEADYDAAADVPKTTAGYAKPHFRRRRGKSPVSGRRPAPATVNPVVFAPLEDA